jgi:hypothetical protein
LVEIWPAATEEKLLALLVEVKAAVRGDSLHPVMVEIPTAVH